MKCFIDYQPPVFHTEAVLPKNFYFNQPRAYMYYYDGRVRQLVRSLLCFSPSSSGASIDVMLYMGVHSFQEPDHCQHLFTGEMKPYDTITHMVLNNQINEAEKLYICMLNPMQNRRPRSALSPASAARHSSPPSRSRRSSPTSRWRKTSACSQR